MPNSPQSKPTTFSPSAGYAAGFAMPERAHAKSPKGLTREVIESLSAYKQEPAWMLTARLNAFEIFKQKPLPAWGGDLSKIDFNDLYYYVRPDERVQQNWDDVPADIKETFDRLGVPEAEKQFLSGSGAQYDSEAVYHNIQKHLTDKGIIFLDTDSALKKYPELFKEYFVTVVPPADNKFSALNSAVWSGGSFLYIPKGVRVDLPLQAYFRINTERMGQFERTLIIADEGSYAHYTEGCTAPAYTTNSLHSAVVEIVVKRGARVRYTTIQNWSKNVYNLVTKRAHVYADGLMEWVDGNLGSALTMKYPSAVLLESGARGTVLSLAMAGDGQHQDSGGKIIHVAPHTSSMIISKSISYGGGRASYRGLVKVTPKAEHARCFVSCDALILDTASRADTYPTMDIRARDCDISHEASVSKIGEEQLFYLQSRGLDEANARSLIVNGFLEPIVKELPMEYAVELNRLIQLEMQGAVG